jgi:hypothetical protein
MSTSSILRYLLLPATHFTVLVFTAVISLALTLTLHAGILGLGLSALLALWLFNYGFVLLESIANGAREPPVLAIETLNLANEWRPLVLLGVILLAMTALGGLVALASKALVGIALGIPFLVALPAFIGALAVGSSVRQALNPSALWHLARTLGLSYLVIIAVVLLYGFVGWQLLRSDISGWAILGWTDNGPTGGADQTLRLAWVVFASLSLFTLIGGSLYEHRLELGHEAIDSPERRQARLQAEIDRDRARFMDRVQAQARGSNLAGAWATLERELSEQRHSFETYDWLLEALSARDDARLARRLAQEYLARALGRDNARATLIAQRGLQIDADFRPRSGAQCLRVAELLRLAGDRRSAQSLLHDFATHFPGDPSIADAQTLLASLTRQPPAA